MKPVSLCLPRRDVSNDMRHVLFGHHLVQSNLDLRSNMFMNENVYFFNASRPDRRTVASLRQNAVSWYASKANYNEKKKLEKVIFNFFGL